MYSSNNILNNNGSNLISYPNQTFSFESNQTSKDETNNSPFPLPPLSFFQFPYSPFEDNEIFLQQQHDFLLHQHQNHHLHHQNLPLEEVVNVNTQEASNNININNNNIPPSSSGEKAGAAGKQIPRKRSSKRDRHSKISTARGLRDRRMRLSLEVAKRFFGLQDMLGFEKASKTVEWLLNQAKLEIKQLARERNSTTTTTTTKSASSTSECEGVSSLDEVVVSGNQEEKKVVKSSRRGNNKVFRKSSFNPVSREKARERARERTKEKMKTKTLVSVVDDKSNSKQCNNGKNHNHNCWNPFETVEESEHQTPSFDVQQQLVQERSSHSKEHLEWNSTMLFNSLNNSAILQQHQFAQFQSLGKPWEDYNSRS